MDKYNPYDLGYTSSPYFEDANACNYITEYIPVCSCSVHVEEAEPQDPCLILADPIVKPYYGVSEDFFVTGTDSGFGFHLNGQDFYFPTQTPSDGIPAMQMEADIIFQANVPSYVGSYNGLTIESVGTLGFLSCEKIDYDYYLFGYSGLQDQVLTKEQFPFFLGFEITGIPAGATTTLFVDDIQYPLVENGSLWTNPIEIPQPAKQTMVKLVVEQDGCVTEVYESTFNLLQMNLVSTRPKVNQPKRTSSRVFDHYICLKKPLPYKQVREILAPVFISTTWGSERWYKSEIKKKPYKKGRKHLIHIKYPLQVGDIIKTKGSCCAKYYIRSKLKRRDRFNNFIIEIARIDGNQLVSLDLDRFKECEKLRVVGQFVEKCKN